MFENFFGERLVQCLKQKITNYLKGITVQPIKHVHSEVRVRHDLSAGYGRRARVEAECPQIHPEMLLLERSDAGRAHLSSRQGPAKGKKLRLQRLRGSSDSLPTGSLRWQQHLHYHRLLLSRPKPFRLK